MGPAGLPASSTPRNTALIILILVLLASTASAVVPTAPPVAPYPLNFFCGDGLCDAPYLRLGEDCGSCPIDCGPCQLASDASECVEPKTYAITFDDGPSVHSRTLLSHLDHLNVSATFFLVGTNIERLGDVLEDEMMKGHSTLSHTYTHRDIITLALSDFHGELQNTENAFQSFTCRRPTLYRPPYGSLDDSHAVIGTRMGKRSVVWNLDTLDWENAVPHPEYVITNLTLHLAEMLPVGIIQLQHDLLLESVNLVPTIIGLIRGAGFDFVPMERCLWGPEYRSHPSWVYMHMHCENGTGSGYANSDYTHNSVVLWPLPNPKTPCPVTGWSEWSDCDTACGDGTQTRIRYSIPPSLQATSACAGVEFLQIDSCTDDIPCSTSPACAFSEWTWWNSSVQCGGECDTVGTQRQYRQLLSGSLPTFGLPPSKLSDFTVTEIERTPRNCGPITRIVTCSLPCAMFPTHSASPTSSPTRTPVNGTLPILYETVTTPSLGGLSVSTIVAFALLGVLGVAIAAAVLLIRRKLKKEDRKLAVPAEIILSPAPEPPQASPKPQPMIIETPGPSPVPTPAASPLAPSPEANPPAHTVSSPRKVNKPLKPTPITRNEFSDSVVSSDEMERSPRRSKKHHRKHGHKKLRKLQEVVALELADNKKPWSLPAYSTYQAQRPSFFTYY